MLTRRRFLELGVVAGLTAVLGRAGAARAAGLDTSALGYLSRASWVSLTGSTVAVAGMTLQLAEVGDLPFLEGRDDAFRLGLTGPPATDTGGTHPFEHPALGSFELFVSPIDVPAAGVQRYEVVVNRSVGVPQSVPTAPSTAPASGATAAPAGGSAMAPASGATTAPTSAATTAPASRATTVPHTHAAPEHRPRKPRRSARRHPRKKPKLRAIRRPVRRR